MEWTKQKLGMSLQEFCRKLRTDIQKNSGLRFNEMDHNHSLKPNWSVSNKQVKIAGALWTGRMNIGYEEAKIAVMDMLGYKPRLKIVKEERENYGNKGTRKRSRDS